MSAVVGVAACAACLGASEVDELEAEGARVDEQVVGLQVAMADALRVHVLERLEGLEEVDPHVVDWEARALLLELERDGADGVGEEIHHQVQVRLVALAPTARGRHGTFWTVSFVGEEASEAAT